LTRRAESAPPHIRNEEELLLRCARTRVSAETGERIRALVRGPLDWDATYSAAIDHGILALLCRNLLAVCPEDVSEEWRKKLKMDILRITQRNLYLAAEMLRLSNLLRAAGLFAVPYKGPMLAAQGYGDFGLRQFVDLDFAVLQRDIFRAQAILLREGYRAQFGEVAPGEGAKPTLSEYQYIRREGNVVVELQTETTLRYFPHPLDFEAMGGRLEQISLAGQEAFTFSAEDTLLLLSVHGAKHFWERLLWIADIAEIIQVKGGVNFERAFARAEELRAGRMLRMALYVASAMLGAPLPDGVEKKIQADSAVRKLGERIRARFSLNAEAPLTVFERFHFRAMSRDKLWQGIPYALRLATSPANPDRADLPLPGWLSGVRRFLRPLLLTKRYGVRRSKTQRDQ
jgi:hypothetical protein